MNTAQITEALESKTTSTAELVDLNDWAVNSLRDYASEHYTAEQQRDLGIMVQQEADRIDASWVVDCRGYRKLSRVGSRFPLTGSARNLVFAIIMSSRKLAKRI